jgi:hypothetical protein
LDDSEFSERAAKCPYYLQARLECNSVVLFLRWEAIPLVQRTEDEPLPVLRAPLALAFRFCMLVGHELRPNFEFGHKVGRQETWLAPASHPRQMSRDWFSSAGSSSNAPLIPDVNAEDAAFNILNDEEDERLLDSPHHPPQQSSPVLPSSTVFLYFLAPHLKLGAIVLSNDDLLLEISIPSIALFAALSSFSRHILYLLSRYLRTTELGEDISSSFLVYL